ncbi:hypothetical protein CHLRE_16g681301v5 [Chlamydomonas reinhardtii]|uniref:Uncharacterized protein n=1 Tax=Chlamydomonas reinhardtii TaxID=3055 RepID=A0A2K3CU25_CHLRE|nr:uncharacterized protein CHLRE_16g681301v5 [Chlamydomonas reinhardtii]PNW71779.1 hypothetical protein CHLRE_16g681301v5 [Chlamydomonas reinhardtii]
MVADDADAPGPSPYSDNYLATFAATTIQRHYRGYRVRKDYQARRARIRKVELEWASHHDYAYRTHMAARAIQTAWRAFRNRRIFNYYRDLIRFRERGDPRELLKVINPREAQLVDAAAGIHVRFRLGGTVFPPLVFYKIFTHRTVVDIGAFGPRDYANEVRMTPNEIHNRPAPGVGGVAFVSAQQALATNSGPGSGAGSASQTPTRRGPGAAAAAAALTSAAGGGGGGGASSFGRGGGTGKKKHTYREDDFELDCSFREYIKPDGTIGVRSTQGWYERYENNGWRPVAERVLLDEDPVTTLTRLKRQPMFHFNPAVRREQRQAVAKQKKREWLRKMYAEGTGGLPRPPRPGSALRHGSGADDAGAWNDANAALEELDGLEEDALDERVDELLNWSSHLDYGAYFDDWTSMACTLASEAFVPEEEAPYLDDLQPVVVGDVRKAMAAAGAPLPPFKGGPNAACGVTMPLAR